MRLPLLSPLRVALVVVFVLSFGLSGSMQITADTSPVAATSPNPATPYSGVVYNTTFWYGDGMPGNKVGRAGLVVTKGGGDEAATVRAIHALGAKAYRYVQFYWAPDDAAYEGIDLRVHPDWAFCTSGSTPSLGRTTPRPDGSTRDWYFLDTNKVAVRQAIRAQMLAYKLAGWDGVFFDRGEAATQYAKDANRNPVWYRTSTCPGVANRAGAAFADAYVSMLGLAHASGLQAMMNTGKSPFDTVTPMRPNPANHYCRVADWSKCVYLTDAWSNLNLVLNETPARPYDKDWTRTFVGNARSERNAAHGHRTVALITTGTLGGLANQKVYKIFYQWSRIKLFNLSVAVNTGDAGCENSMRNACNQAGAYPKLVNTRFAKPLWTQPVRQGCINRSKVHCLWFRRYSKGINLVNVSGATRKKPTVTTGLSTCRYVWDVYYNRPLASTVGAHGPRCVKTFTLKMLPWSGRPLLYSPTKFTQSPV